MLPTKLLFRTACGLAACWESRPGMTSKPESISLDQLDSDYRALQAVMNRLASARRHGLSLVLATLQAELLAKVEDL
jgi:hypothetical protein